LKHSSIPVGYAVAVVSVALATALRLALDPVLGPELAPYPTLFAGIVIAAWYGGRGPGLLAVVIAGVTALFFLMPPRGAFALQNAEYISSLVVFMLTSVFLVLLTAALRDARQRAEVADRRKNEFLATLAHELRNPVAPIRNSLSIMRRAPDDLERVEQSRRILERQVDHLSRLIDDLLDVGRITANRLELRLERLDLATPLQGALEFTNTLFRDKGHVLTVAPPSESLYLNGDAVRLTQVFGNILNNAAKYTAPGGRISVTTQRQGNEAIIRVRDSGCGIAREDQAVIFETFARLDQGPDALSNGLGIGLSLARRLVEMHGGRIDVHSDGVGKGSEFSVYLPVLSERLAPRAAALEQTPISSGAGVRILVVDDNHDSADTLGALLELAGYAVEVAYDGVSSIAAADRFHPQAVLLDIGMPEMDGYAVASRLRQRPGGDDTLLIAITGWGQPADKQHALDAGFDHHLTKPVNPSTLLALLSRPRDRT
jgi:signal transduction histidine kinase/ActR/RegA family two-component response regulator